jgi:4-hydroxy-tetrahydrodipicolinate synthase
MCEESLLLPPEEAMHSLGKGVLTVAPTPFDSTDEIDLKSLERLTEVLLAAGVDGIVLLGVLGEAHTLVGNERNEIIEAVIARVDGSVPVVVGTSHPSAVGAAKLSRDAERLGASAVMVSVPHVARPDRNVIVRYFDTVAEGLGIDIVLQDYPGTSGFFLTPDSINELAQRVPLIRHIKLEDPPTPQKISLLRERVGERLNIFGGLGGVFFLEELLRGAAGTMTGFAFPEMLLEVHRSFVAGDVGRASDLFFHYLPLIRFESQQDIGLAIRKRAYRLRGAIDDERVRSLGPGLDGETTRELESLLARFGLP